MFCIYLFQNFYYIFLFSEKQSKFTIENYCFMNKKIRKPLLYILSDDRQQNGLLRSKNWTFYLIIQKLNLILLYLYNLYNFNINLLFYCCVCTDSHVVYMLKNHQITVKILFPSNSKKFFVWCLIISWWNVYISMYNCIVHTIIYLRLCFSMKKWSSCHSPLM